MTVKLYLDQLDNGWVMMDETEALSCSSEIVEDKNIRYQLGSAIFEYMRSAMDEVASNGCELEINIKPVDSRLNKTITP